MTYSTGIELVLTLTLPFTPYPHTYIIYTCIVLVITYVLPPIYTMLSTPIEYLFLDSSSCYSDHSDKATICPRRPLQPGPRDAMSSQMTLDMETTWLQRPHFEGPLSGLLRQVSLYEGNPGKYGLRIHYMP